MKTNMLVDQHHDTNDKNNMTKISIERRNNDNKDHDKKSGKGKKLLLLELALQVPLELLD